MTSAQTPLGAIIRIGTNIFIEEATGRRHYLCSAPNRDLAEWVAGSLAQYHMVELRHEPEPKRVPAPLRGSRRAR